MNRDSVLETKKKPSFAPSIMTAICFCLLAAMAVGAAIAYLADTDRAKNALSIGGNRVEIVEQFMPPQEMTPGISFAKDVKVTNTGTVDCYVRVFAAFSDSDMGDYCSVDWNTADWVKEADGYWYNTTSIAPGETTSSLFTTITLSDTIPDVSIKDFDMIVYAESFQSEGYPDYPTAWTDYKRNKPAPLTGGDAPILESGSAFNAHIPSTVTAVVFTDQVAPDGAALTDVSEAGDGSVVAWVDGVRLYVSSQWTGIPIMANADSASMFKNKSSLTSIDLTLLDTSNVTTMEDMFFECSGLTSLDVSGFDTTNVTRMDSMFRNCSGLTSLDVSDWNTSNVVNMNGTFVYCSGLTSLDVSGWDTSSVTHLGALFGYCPGLTTLDVSGFDTANVTNMNGVFGACSGLTSITFGSGWDTRNVANMDCMFAACSRLTVLDVSNFNTAKVTDMNNMFCECHLLSSITFGSGWTTANVTDISWMFGYCEALTLDCRGWNVNKVTQRDYFNLDSPGVIAPTWVY